MAAMNHHHSSPLLLKNPPYSQTSLFNPSFPIQFHKYPLRISSELAPKARIIARRKETVPVHQLQRPLCNITLFPLILMLALLISVLGYFLFWVVDRLPVFIGILLNALTLVWYGNAASMVNRISCGVEQSNSEIQQLTSDAVIEVSIDVPFPFRAIPVQMIESNGARVLEQILVIMLPRFMAQLVKDYQAWASGDTSRQPLGTGQI
uniref:Uncharacterized protein n=1 Tax=Chenopodium quinoa TaxID=63459 RepID=A0A803MGW3_CHEQI